MKKRHKFAGLNKQALRAQNYMVRLTSSMDATAKVLGSLVWPPKERRRHPRPRRSLAVLQAVKGRGGLDVIYVLMGIMSIVMILNNEYMSGWVTFSWFMCGVSALLGVVQRGGLAYHNQTMMWLGAQEPLLPLHKDDAVITAIGFRSLFQILAVITMWGKW